MVAFHRDYYGPNNAVIGIAGDVDAKATFALVEKHFGAIPRRPAPPGGDFEEGLNEAPRHLEQADALARVPAIAIGWKMPKRGSADHVPMAVLSDVLVAGDASRLYQGLVKGRELLLQAQGGMNWPLGDPFDFDGPTLFTLFGLYKPTTNAAAVVAAVEEEIAQHRGGRRRRRHAGARQDQAAVGLLLQPGGVHLARRLAGEGPGHVGRRRRAEPGARLDREGDLGRPAARRQDVLHAGEPQRHRSQARAAGRRAGRPEGELRVTP